MEPKCPKCNSINTYEDRQLWVCAECAHEWNQTSSEGQNEDEQLVVRDANGVTLQDGDSVTVIKDLKVKGSSLVVKVGTKVKGIRLVEGADGHNISCKIGGIGAMNLKSEFVKKS